MFTGPEKRILRILENRRSIGIGQSDCTHARQEGDWRYRTDIEAAQVVLAAHIGALERRSNQSGKPVMKDPCTLKPNALRRFWTGMNRLYCTIGRMERIVPPMPANSAPNVNCCPW
jgi:hypothetical protein